MGNNPSSAAQFNQLARRSFKQPNKDRAYCTSIDEEASEASEDVGPLNINNQDNQKNL